MKANSQSGSLFTHLIRPLLVGLCVGVIACTLLLMLSAAVIGTVDVPQQVVFPLSMVAAGVATLLAGLVTARLAGKNGLLMGLLCGLLLFLLIMVAGFLRFSDAGFTSWATKLAILLVAGGLGGVLGVGKRSK